MAKSFTFSINTTLLISASVAFLLGLGLGWWQPWTDDVQRTINVSGSATLDAQPDEYRFTPYIEVGAESQATAKQQAAELGDELAQELIALGVPENKITSNSSNYRAYYFDDEGEYKGNYYLEVIVDNEELSQQVYDALVASDAVTGGEDPQATFSESLSKQLERDARAKAVDDAKAQAEVAAQELGLKVGKVVTVKDGQQYGGIEPYAIADGLNTAESTPARDTNFYQGTDEYRFAVTATFELR